MRRAHYLAVLTFVVFSGGCSSKSETSPPTTAEAIEIVCEPQFGFDNMDEEVQVCNRLMWLMHFCDYTYKEAESQAWKVLMLDKKANLYGRLCAAYFLLDDHEDARNFVGAYLESNNVRHRYNAAKILQMHFDREPSDERTADLLIKAIENASLDDTRKRFVLKEYFPDGDGFDIMFSPLEDICYSLGFNKVKKAVPAIIRVLERQPANSSAAFALGEIGDKRGAPILMKILQEGSGYNSAEVTALGKLRHRPAVPILIDRLGKPRISPDGMHIIDTRKILEALLQIGDKRAIEPLKEYLKGDYPKESQAVAKRVLVQLEDEDPVDGLVKLLANESYEPEKANIIRDLSTHKDDRVVQTLVDTGKHSNSGFLRREAIYALGRVNTRTSLLGITDLFGIDFSNLSTRWGWKIAPDFTEYFPDLIQEVLRDATNQDFGSDIERWQQWIRENVPE